MSRIKPIEYQGPPTEYVPNIGQTSLASNAFPPVTSSGSGYSDLDYLNELLDQLTQKVGTIYSEAQGILQGFGLIIKEDDTALWQAQNMAYPSSEIPSVVSFEQYKYLQANNTTSATQYIISIYENEVRGISGTNALDISNLVSYVKNEISRIKEFIDGFIGEVDDSSEQRTIESFQDWAEDTAALVEKFWQALKGKVTARLPQSELDQLSQETAVQLQALLQVKLNKINQNIKNLNDQLIKNWEETSDVFYNKHLGPALKFQLKVGRNITLNANANKLPIIAGEIIGTMSGIDSNFSGILADQIKRNKMFIGVLGEILLNIAQRDTYYNYVEDLATLGKPIPSKFTSSAKLEHPEIIAKAVFDGVDAMPIPSIDFDDNFNAVHSSLTGLDDDNAHPQYLLRTGGLDSIITGDVFLAENVTIDGIVPSTHRHTGQDGSEKIRGSDIDYNSITELNIDTTNSSTSVPENLAIVSQTSQLIPSGVVKVTAKLEFDVETSSNIVGYEFEVIKL